MRAAAVLALLLAAAAPASAQEATLEWRTGTVGDALPRRVPLHEQAPEGVKMPEGEFEGMLFGSLPLGDVAKLSFGVTSEILLIDRDLDGDLAPEMPVKWRGSTSRRYYGIHLGVPFSGGEAPASVQAVLVYQPGAKPPRVDLTLRAYRRGKVVLAGRERLVVLVDSDGDLRFEAPDRDPLYVDLDGNGKVRTGEGSHEELRAGLPFALKGRGYVATIPAISGAKVVFRPVEPAPPPPPRRWNKSIKRRKAGVSASGRGNLEKLASEYQKQLDSGAVPWMRYRVVERIGQVGSREAFALLWRIYKKDGAELVRQTAVRAMGYVQYVERADKVAKIASSDRDPKVRIEAARALHGMAAPGREKTYVRLLMRSRDEAVVAAVAEYLAFTGTESARLALLNAVEHHSRVGCRYAAYRAGTRYFRALPPDSILRAAARSADERLAAMGLKDLHDLGRPEARDLALQAAKGKVRTVELAMVLAEVLATEGDREAVAALLPLAEMDSATVRGRMRDLLAPVRDAGGIGAMADALTSPEAKVRGLCARVLARIPGAEATRALAERLARERDPEVALALIRSLADRQGAEAARAIVDVAPRYERDEKMRAAIVRALADVGMQHEPVRAYFEKKMESHSWEERVLAIGAAARAEARSLVPALIANLDHRQWQVRIAAVQAFRRIRVKEAIPPLIGRLDEEQEKRIRTAIGETLYRLTGQNFFADYDLWVRWWAGSRETFEIPDKLDHTRVKPGTRTVARFYGLPVESERVVFVIDQSGSMSSMTGERSDYQNAVREVLRVADRLDRGAKINVILFETEIHPWRSKLVNVNATSRAALKKHLESNGPTGGTNLFDGLAMALEHKGVDTVYLLSDGSPTTGKYVEEHDILREIRRINELRRITLHCVSLGRDSSLLRRLAEEHGGRYVRR